MALADTETDFGPARTKEFSSKVDQILDQLPADDRETFLKWLRDPNWTGHSIAKALHEYSKVEGRDFTMGHSTIDRWRMHHEIKVSSSGAR